jgi:hypothetical protein
MWDEEDGCTDVVIELLRSSAGQPVTNMHRTDFQKDALCVEEEADAQTRLSGLVFDLGWSELNEGLCHVVDWNLAG